jgi:hypothetical protein
MFEVSMFSSPASACEPVSDTRVWTVQRRAPRQTDSVLTDVTRTWLHRLPLRRRPLRLAAQFPRVANRIALCWGEAALAEQVLADLLVDRRGGRCGFPVLVTRELQRLRDYRLA